MEVPKLDKVVINMGVGEAKDNAKLLEAAIVFDFRENQLFFDTKSIVTSSVKCVWIYASKVTYTRQCKVVNRNSLQENIIAAESVVVHMLI